MVLHKQGLRVRGNMKYRRNINLPHLLKNKSVLLLGARSTGKSFYIRNQLDNIYYINLLKSSEFLLLSNDPDELENIAKFLSQQYKL